jgi:phosphonate transport system ATP-binding protein
MSGGRIVFDGPPARLDDGELTAIYGGKGWLQ